MWKSLNPGDSVSLGDIIRYISAHAVSAFGAKSYEVIKTEMHYFEIAPKEDNGAEKEQPKERKIVRYFDIGYNLGLEVWLDHVNSGF